MNYLPVISYSCSPYEQRRLSILYDAQDNVIKKIYYNGNYELIEANGNTYEVNYLFSPEGLFGIAVKENNNPVQVYYVETDHLGSILGLYNEAGQTVYSQSFDAWGRERNPTDWSYSAGGGSKPAWLIRGYTGHEHLPEQLSPFGGAGGGLINMNGRMYDPILGRMLSPDNFVQDPSSTQSFNRYSYCWNNPLKYTDPSGEVVWFVPVIIGAAIGAYAGASIQSGTLNLTQWDNDWWKGAIVGGILGAGAGYLAAAALPALGVSVTTTSGVAAFGSGATATSAMTVTSQALLSGSIGIGSNYAQGRGLDGAWKAGLIGLGTGALSAGIDVGLTKSVFSSYLEQDVISTIAQISGGGVYGSVDRYIRLREDGVRGWELAGYTALGFLEGATIGGLSGGKMSSVNVIQTSLTTSLTSFPGLGLSVLENFTNWITLGHFNIENFRYKTNKYPRFLTVDGIAIDIWNVLLQYPD